MNDAPRLRAAGRLAAAFVNSKLTPLFVLASILLGVFAVVKLPREEEPQIIVPMIDIFVEMPGASAREVEERVTKPMEKLLWEIPGVEYIYSTSSPGMSMAVVRFLVGEDEEKAIVRLNQKMFANLDLIPPGASPPLIKPRSIDDVPILALTLWSKRYGDYDLRRLAAQLHDTVKQVDQVSAVALIGGQRRQMRVDLDETRLAGYHLSPSDVAGALGMANRRLPAGSLSNSNREFVLEAGSFLTCADDVRRVVVGVADGRPVFLGDVAGGRPVFLGDVARVQDGPQTMASSVATPLEKQFGEIPYLTQMTSTSSLGYTSIILQFALNDDINAAAQLVQAAINAASGQLPKDMPTPPVYHETNPADAPILVIGLTSTTLPITTVDDYTESILAQKLSQVPGVGLIAIGGGQHPAIRLQIDPVKLAAAGLDLEQVRSALTNISVDQPKGNLYGNTRSYALQTNDQLLNPTDWNNQIIAYRNGGSIRVSDVGQAVIGPQDKTLGGWVNQDQGVVLAIQRLPGANVISTVQRLKALLPQLMSTLPPAIKVTVVSDRTTTIRASVSDVQFTLLLTVGLVVGVIFVFLRSLWATIIPAIAVPVSIIGTFAVMYLLNYSLDNLSLMGLSIAVGFVVDDAIVMVENIARHIEMGKTPLQAAFDGAGEIGFTILSMSVSLIAVFIPLLMMSGLVGRLFQEFAVVVTVAIAVSALVSLTLTPMMGGRLLRQRHAERQGRLSRGLERAFDSLVSGYDKLLGVVLRHRFITLMVMLGTVALTAYLFLIIPKGFFRRRIPA